MSCWDSQTEVHPRVTPSLSHLPHPSSLCVQKSHDNKIPHLKVLLKEWVMVHWLHEASKCTVSMLQCLECSKVDYGIETEKPFHFLGSFITSKLLLVKLFVKWAPWTYNITSPIAVTTLFWWIVCSCYFILVCQKSANRFQKTFAWKSDWGRGNKSFWCRSRNLCIMLCRVFVANSVTHQTYIEA